MGNARVCQQALDAALYECQDVSTHNSQNGDSPDYRYPIRLCQTQHNIEDARKSNKGSRFSAYGHKGRHRCGCANIDIGRPRLERYC